MSDGELLPGPMKIDCPDGCGLFGRPTRNGHVQGCKGPEGAPCRSCIGRRNKAKGRKKQRRAQVALGMTGLGTTLGPNHEENWSGHLRVEVKAGAQVRAANTAFRKMRTQSEASRPFGDVRPFIGVAMPDGESDGLVMCRLSDLPSVALAVVATLEETDGEPHGPT